MLYGHAPMIFNFLACFVKSINKYKVRLLLWKHLIVLKIERRFQKLLQISVPAFLLSHWSIFFGLHSYRTYSWLSRKLEQASWRGLLEGFSELVSDFKEARRKSQIISIVQRVWKVSLLFLQIYFLNRWWLCPAFSVSNNTILASIRQYGSRQ